MWTAHAADAEKSEAELQAELLRTFSAPVFQEGRATSESVPLTAGEVYPVLKEGILDVMLKVDGKEVRVSNSDVKIVKDGAQGDYVNIISAKYGYPGGNGWEVKQEIRKQMPENPLTKPVKILVSDQLLRAKAGTMVKVVIKNGVNTYVPRNDGKLTITYEVNGVRKVQEVKEDAYLTLP